MAATSKFSDILNNKSDSQNKRVVYYYDEEVGNFYYGQNHPMKPHRMRMTHSLIVNYGLFKKMEVYRPYRLKEREMTLFHADDYIHFLKTVTPDNEATFGTDLDRFNIDIDCPIFDGVYRFCQISAGGSVGAAYKLNHGLCDIGINWAGGLHHAKKCEASGFCYVNDIVLAILELLKFHDRVLYIDIDIHHGDGVEEAFYTTNRVMTLSFHKYGDFFPGTGNIKDKGVGFGENYSINVPLYEGITDETFLYCFKPIITQIMKKFAPGAIVLQLGADSLAGDRLGCFNLSISGHGQCVRIVKDFGVPLMLLGGGGYTLRNVARCWTYETSIACNVDLDPKLPYHEYYEYFAPDYTLATIPTNMLNINKKEYLDETITTVFKYLSQIEVKPNVGIQDSRTTLGISEQLQKLQAQIGHKIDENNSNDNDKDMINSDNNDKPINDTKQASKGPRMPLIMRNANANANANGNNNNKNNGDICGAPEWHDVLNNNSNNGNDGTHKRSSVSIRDVKLQQDESKDDKTNNNDNNNKNIVGIVPSMEQEKHMKETLEDDRHNNDVNSSEPRISSMKSDEIIDDKREFYENDKDQDKSGSSINITGGFNKSIAIVKAKSDSAKSNNSDNNNNNKKGNDKSNENNETKTENDKNDKSQSDNNGASKTGNESNDKKNGN